MVVIPRMMGLRRGYHRIALDWGYQTLNLAHRVPLSGYPGTKQHEEGVANSPELSHTTATTAFMAGGGWSNDRKNRFNPRTRR